MRLRDLGKLWPYNKLLDAMVNDSQAMASPEMEEWYRQLATVGMEAVIPNQRIQSLSAFQKLLFIRWVWVYDSLGFRKFTQLEECTHAGMFFFAEGITFSSSYDSMIQSPV